MKPVKMIDDATLDRWLKQMEEAEPGEGLRLAIASSTWVDLFEMAKEANRARETIGAIGDILFEMPVHEDHVEHVVRDHGPKAVEANFRFLAKQIRAIDEEVAAFNEPILAAIEDRDPTRQAWVMEPGLDDHPAPRSKDTVESIDQLRARWRSHPQDARVGRRLFVRSISAVFIRKETDAPADCVNIVDDDG